MTNALRIAADVGGTFTDIACIDAAGELSTCKIPSTPHDYAQAIVAGIEQLIQGHERAASSVTEVLHASTVATNAILEGKGARTALITTDGFRDVLELRRIRVPRLYEPLYEKPAPLVPRRRRYEVRERLDARGEIVAQLDEAQVRSLADTLANAGVEAIAVCFLHAYLNPAHERRVAEILRAALPNSFISVSSDVLPEIREYERTSTTVVNAYVGPVMSRYLSSLRERLATRGVRGRLLMMQSSGGMMDLEQVIARPATVVESGPAAGVVGAVRLGTQAGYANLITFDMGGTTAKASLIEDGAVITTDEYEVGGGISLSSGLAKGGGYALKLPVIDVSEVGAGGGSIVRVDAGGALKVGPRSAGAIPGPACYAKGGTEATVTDASVVLGYLNPDSLAGGTVAIDSARAQAAVGMIAARLEMDVLDLAFGIHRLANSTMMRAVKAVSTYRGRDPREFALFAFGGNGGVHAAALAQELQMQRVVVPLAAGVFSAVGLLCADHQAVRSKAFLRPLNVDSVRETSSHFLALERQALAELGVGEGATVRWRAELRYAGQGFEIPVEFERDASTSAQEIRACFEREYRRAYGHALDHQDIDFVALRVVATAPPRGPRAVSKSRAAAHRAPTASSRKAYFGTEYGLVETPVVQRCDLGSARRAGPLIVEEYEGTTVVPPGAGATLDACDNIVITFEEECSRA
jgi:N-methylhydantoinase A